MRAQVTPITFPTNDETVIKIADELNVDTVGETGPVIRIPKEEPKSIGGKEK